jgi:hypothetical protein
MWTSIRSSPISATSNHFTLPEELNDNGWAADGSQVSRNFTLNKTPLLHVTSKERIRAAVAVLRRS